MQNKKPKFTDQAYQNMLEELTRKIYLVKSQADDELTSDIDKDKWVETSRKEINLKQGIDLLTDYNSHYDYQIKNRIYKYDGTIDFKKGNLKSIRKLIQIEPRIIKEIYNCAEHMFKHLFEYKLSSTKYRKLYEMMTEQNEYNKLLLELEKELRYENDMWDSLFEYSSYPNDDYCNFDEYTEHEQIEMKTKHNIKINNMSEKINYIKSLIENLNKHIKKLSEEGIKEKDIANTF